MVTLQQLIDAQKTVKQGGNGDWLYYIVNPDTGKRELAYSNGVVGAVDRCSSEPGWCRGHLHDRPLYALTR